MILDTISLTDCRLNAIIGILDFEQQRRQPLDVSLDMFLPLEPAADSEDVGDTVDYAMITAQLELLVNHGRWWLLESLAKTICRTVLIPPSPAEARADVREIELRLTKPTILDGRAVPGIAMRRTTAWCRIHREELPGGGELDWLAKTRLCDVARLRLHPDDAYTLPRGAHALTLAGLEPGVHAPGSRLHAKDHAAALVVWAREPSEISGS
ncbi:MAG: dihydroneopterin aldolase [Deltaproteobacteria bacterium]|nr:MAG: dihydroneopterin aldolase [Deltaproteobacteria bacterium]